ncbi:urease accessory protein UreD [Streptomyces sp. NPDC004830]
MRPDGNTARVGIIGAMSGQLGGDRLTIDVTASDRAAQDVTTAAATLALRGPTTAPATYDVRLTAGDHAHLRWLPQLLISAAGSTVRVARQPSAVSNRRRWAQACSSCACQAIASQVPRS